MSDFMFGVCHPGRAYEKVRDVGIQWVRVDIPFPFANEGEELSEKFESSAAYVRELRRNGFQVVGITPYPKAIPDWEGPPASDGYFSLTREAARFLGEFFNDDIPIWQSTNEMNVDGFREPLTHDESVRFVIEGALGIKEASKELWVGANMGGFGDKADELYRKLYQSDTPWDYVGADGYFGTWQEGGPHTWEEKFDWLGDLTPLPAIVMEWGFSSDGDIMDPADVIPNETDPHGRHMWCFGWGGRGAPIAHTPEAQAMYIEEAMEIITDRAIGEFYYCWSDAKTCWCGRDDCPIESRWGLVDYTGAEKPSYGAMKRAIRRLGG